jgi:hypothetical protein
MLTTKNSARGWAYEWLIHLERHRETRALIEAHGEGRISPTILNGFLDYQ